MKEDLTKEKAELDEKIKKLFDFFSQENKLVSDKQLSLMKTQYNHMRSYSVCLGKRIENLN